MVDEPAAGESTDRMVNEEQELSRRRIKLLDGETIESIFDSDKGTIDEVGGLAKGFLLTNKRLVHFDGVFITRTRAGLLQDISYLETRHKGKAVTLALAAAPWIAVIFYSMWWASTIGQVEHRVGEYPLRSWAFTGLMFVAAIWSALSIYSAGTTISTRIGGRTCKVKYDKSAEKDAEEFAATFFKHKSKVSGD